MHPVYLDLHIHTSKDPNNLNQNYDLDTLINRVSEKAGGNEYLISITDHNTINEKVYLEAFNKIGNKLILGVELHIQTHRGQDSKAYHCHIYFDFDGAEITSDIIKDINEKLGSLYPNKCPKLRDHDIPIIQEIIEAFDYYDFILLPHGGQTHATFDEAMPQGNRFDNAMHRSIYYNFFDGFTSRSDIKTEETKGYLERLGVNEFINLITCSDNYDPTVYPNPKGEETYKFIPTWMYATPTFGGLRLSLSDNSRLVYSHEKPREWRESIKKIKLDNDNINIDIQLTSGLNVIIGESSSGKTLLVDSLCRKLTGKEFEDCKYEKEFKVSNIAIDYPENLHPHFIEQNFITESIVNKKPISEIPIIQKILPENTEARKKIDRGLHDLHTHLTDLFDSVENIESISEDIKRIPVISELIIGEETEENILCKFLDTINSLEDSTYSEVDKELDIDRLDTLEDKLIKNPFVEHDKSLIKKLKAEIDEMRSYSILEEKIRNVILVKKKEIDFELQEKVGHSQEKRQSFEKLIRKMKDYYAHLTKFEDILEKISNYSIEERSEIKQIKEYSLSIENKFQLKKEIILKEINKLLLATNQIENYENIIPEKLYRKNFNPNMKGNKAKNITYQTIVGNIKNNISDSDRINYKIFTPDDEDYDDLSPGRKTAIILELILNFEDDSAPLIIDQPEDNLATSYMNEGLVTSIKKMKHKKQIIFVSHNATIPMSGDAQNIILCENNGGKIYIKSAPLEGKINDINVVDYVAKIADGGKPSIKKRFKKYNLKKFK